jgi:hypothetical protein
MSTPSGLAPSLAPRASSPAEATLVRRARWVLLLSAAVTVALYVVPQAQFLAYPLMLISTVVHELGHGIASLLVGGTFVEFRMYSNGSGVAMHGGIDGNFASAFVSAGGLVGPALAAGVFLGLGRRPAWARLCLLAFGVFLTVCLFLWVRGSFSIVFVAGLAATCIAIGLLASAQLSQLALVFLAVQLALSAYARSDYLFTKYAETGKGLMPSDVQQMANALILPYWFWGALCAAFSILVLLVGGWRYLRGPRAPRVAVPTTRVP